MEYFTSGNKERDEELAKEYQKKAILLYGEVVKDSKVNSNGIPLDELEETDSRRKDLDAGIRWNKTWVIDD